MKKVAKETSRRRLASFAIKGFVIYKNYLSYSQIVFLVCKILPGETENSSSPHSIRSGISFESAAASPHIPT